MTKLKEKGRGEFDELVTEYVIEWCNKNKNFKYGFWVNNNPENKVRDVVTKFEQILMRINLMAKTLIQYSSIVRFFWTQNDIRELALSSTYCPYISVSGTYFIDVLTYPSKSNSFRNWNYREVVGDKYKINLSDNKDQYSTAFKFRFTIQLPKNVWVPNLNNIIVGRYQTDTQTWALDSYEIKIEPNQTVSFRNTDVGIYSLLVQRTNFFPYLNWRVRCIDPTTAILNLESK